MRWTGKYYTTGGPCKAYTSDLRGGGRGAERDAGRQVQDDAAVQHDFQIYVEGAEALDVTWAERRYVTREDISVRSHGGLDPADPDNV